MIILGLDAATNVGWAVYDTDRHHSAIRMGSFRCGASNDTEPEKIRTLRSALPKILKAEKPGFVAIEAPLDNIKAHEKSVTDPLTGEERVITTVNAKATLISSGLAYAATMCVAGYNLPFVWVRPQTWRTIIPINMRKSAKDNKAAVKAFCETLRIAGGNEHGRDAATIAFWAAGHCQELKMMQRVEAAG
ncbi:hypothetical protein [Oceaniradius stylonematis]|uniref:hypothetical protein n=1 Tax=Oceaniradius stylonematis TaxID=2184161 RepID=UPI00273D0E02|nr:hypothetical protein [Oceaniradius stylonematis]